MHGKNSSYPPRGTIGGEPRNIPSQERGMPDGHYCIKAERPCHPLHGTCVNIIHVNWQLIEANVKNDKENKCRCTQKNKAVGDGVTWYIMILSQGGQIN
jgi:hypothetical protein